MVQWFKTFYFVNVAQPCAFTNIKELIRLVYLIQYWLHSNTCLVGKWGNTSLLACSESAIPVFFDSGILKWSEIILASELESYGCWRYKAGSMSGKDLSLNIVCSSSQSLLEFAESGVHGVVISIANSGSSRNLIKNTLCF